MNIPSYLVREGDKIEVAPKAKEMALVIEAMASAERTVPDYIEVNEKEMSGTYVRTPKLADIPYASQMEPNLVVEYYSR